MVLSMIAGSIIFLIMLLPKSQIGLSVEVPVPTYTPAGHIAIGTSAVAIALAGWNWPAGQQHSVWESGYSYPPGGQRQSTWWGSKQKKPGRHLLPGWI